MKLTGTITSINNKEVTSATIGGGGNLSFTKKTSPLITIEQENGTGTYEITISNLDPNTEYGFHLTAKWWGTTDLTFTTDNEGTQTYSWDYDFQKITITNTEGNIILEWDK